MSAHANMANLGCADSRFDLPEPSVVLLQLPAPGIELLDALPGCLGGVGSVRSCS